MHVLSNQFLSTFTKLFSNKFIFPKSSPIGLVNSYKDDLFQEQNLKPLNFEQNSFEYISNGFSSKLEALM